MRLRKYSPMAASQRWSGRWFSGIAFPQVEHFIELMTLNPRVVVAMMDVDAYGRRGISSAPSAVISSFFLWASPPSGACASQRIDHSRFQPS